MKHFLVTASFCFFDFFLVLSSVSTISARTQGRPRATREPIKFSQATKQSKCFSYHKPIRVGFAHINKRVREAEWDETLGLWRNEFWETVVTVQSSGHVSLAPQGILVLATKRTNMPDILSGLKCYRRGWDIADPHY